MPSIVFCIDGVRNWTPGLFSYLKTQCNVIREPRAGVYLATRNSCLQYSAARDLLSATFPFHLLSFNREDVKESTSRTPLSSFSHTQTHAFRIPSTRTFLTQGFGKEPWCVPITIGAPQQNSLRLHIHIIQH